MPGFAREHEVYVTAPTWIYPGFGITWAHGHDGDFYFWGQTPGSGLEMNNRAAGPEPGTSATLGRWFPPSPATFRYLSSGPVAYLTRSIFLVEV